MNGIADLDEGYAGTLADVVRTEAIAARRVAIQRRGREQSS